MHPEYEHDYIQPDFEHQLRHNALTAQESIQYLFFQWPGIRYKMIKKDLAEN